MACLKHGTNLYFSPMLVKQFVVGVGAAIASVVQVVVVVEMANDGFCLRGSAAPSADFRAYLGGAMLRTGAVSLSA